MSSLLVVNVFFFLTETCPLPPIQNGMWNLTIDVSPHRRIHKAEYRCDQGYLLDADGERRRCSPEGLFDSKDQYIKPNEWSGREPKCLLIGRNKSKAFLAKKCLFKS